MSRLFLMEQCFNLEGFLYADGTAEKMERRNSKMGSAIVVHGRAAWKPDPLEEPDEITILNFRCLPNLSLKLYCGEGGWGGTGFVALSDLADSLIWIGLFHFSNPFVSVDYSLGEVLATNNREEVWHFPVEKPSEIRIDCGPFDKAPTGLTRLTD